jgi:hypothetical protein
VSSCWQGFSDFATICRTSAPGDWPTIRKYRIDVAPGTAIESLGKATRLGEDPGIVGGRAFRLAVSAGATVRLRGVAATDASPGVATDAVRGFVVGVEDGGVLAVLTAVGGVDEAQPPMSVATVRAAMERATALGLSKFLIL